MGYIGTKPSAVPLTSADITDGIITSAKIADGTIVNADINATSAITLNKLSGNPNFRNIVINGDMQVAQRNTSVSSITASGYYTADRFITFISSLGTWTQSQSTDVPTGQGFANSLKLDCTTADATPSASDYIVLSQLFEGQNLQYLKKGTANAVPLTASFWVKSTKTGTFILQLNDSDNTRTICKSYTVNTTNTWEKKTITFEGDTTGTLNNDNNDSLRITFYLGVGTNYSSGTLQTTWGTTVDANVGVGQVNVADSTSNDWLITGVQLEAGTSATDFEFLPIDVSLGRCQRYYYKTQPATGGIYGSALNNNTTRARAYINFPIVLRANPSSLETSGTAGNYSVLNDGDNAVTCSSVPSFATGEKSGSLVNFDVSSGLTSGEASMGRSSDGVGYLAWSAEL